MNQQRSRILQEARTTLAPQDVLAAARQFFQRRNNVYAAFVEQEGPTHLSFRGQGGEELLIAVRPIVGGTAVTGSTYLFDQQIGRFFVTLPPPPPEAEQEPSVEAAPAIAEQGA